MNLYTVAFYNIETKGL